MENLDFKVPGIPKPVRLKIFISSPLTAVTVYCNNETYEEVREGKLMPVVKELKRVKKEFDYEGAEVYPLIRRLVNGKLEIEQVVFNLSSQDDEYTEVEFKDYKGWETREKFYLNSRPIIQVNLENQDGYLFNLITDYETPGLLEFVNSLIESKSFLNDYFRLVRKVMEKYEKYELYRLPYAFCPVKRRNVENLYIESVGFDAKKVCSKKSINKYYEESEYKNMYS